MGYIKVSPQFSLNTNDWQQAAKSALIFLAPSIVSFLVVLIPAVSAIVPTTTEKLILLTVVKWALDQALGIARRWASGNPA